MRTIQSTIRHYEHVMSTEGLTDQNLLELAEMENTFILKYAEIKTVDPMLRRAFIDADFDKDEMVRIFQTVKEWAQQ